MTNPTGPGQWLRAADRRNTLIFIGAALLLWLAILAAGDEIKDHAAAVETWIAGLGPWGIAGFVAINIAATSLLVPESALSIIAGALFGLAWGIAAAALAMLLAAVLQYALARRLLHERIERLLAGRPLLVSIERAVKKQEFRLQLPLRLAPLNPATISYLLGATGVRFGGFVLALALISRTAYKAVLEAVADQPSASVAASQATPISRHRA
jgi:uncharacterized membrane protein YdjX (TVP38/TMEM64 family)